MALALALVLHAHQPAGNFDSVIEQAYQTSYQPLLAAAAERPWLRLNLHYSGFLLDWLSEHHPEYLEQLRQLLRQGRLELLGGGYYEPILAVIPPQDQQEQMGRMAAALERHFGLRPRGAWLAERVWEPALPVALAAAGMDYTLLDDNHFQLAGCSENDLHGYWITEDQGAEVRVVPCNDFLRQAIPFRPEGESLDYLLDAAQRRRASLLTMGDDLEKFGSWPHTFQHVYQDGWLKRFLDGLESHREHVETVRLGDYLDNHPARGLLYLPTASYPEMMKWAGSASWRGFLSKYREANLLHKTLWDLHRRLQTCDPTAACHREALTHLLAAECNDVYWHGWFGGLYSPHLRNLTFSHLLAADGLIEAMATGPLSATELRRFDLHRDGHEVLELRTPELRLLLAPAEGGTIEEIDFRAANANLINSIQRRPETYHEELRRGEEHNPAHLPTADSDPAEPNAAALDAHLLYDPYPRSAGRLYLCPPGKTFADFQRLQLDAEPGPAGGTYSVTAAAPGRVTLANGGVRKIVAIERNRVEITAELDAETGAPLREPALEMVFNLLAADAADRYFEQAGQCYTLRWAGKLPPEPLTLRDGWRRLDIRLEAPGARAWWIQPLYTVSQSESGFEALYQGSAIAAAWPPGTRRFRLTTKIFLQ